MSTNRPSLSQNPLLSRDPLLALLDAMYLAVRSLARRAGSAPQ